MTLSTIRDAYDVVVVGAGPAGLAAATVAAEEGCSTLLVDENPGPGGQIYRAIASTPVTDRAVLGQDYWHGEGLVEAARTSGATILQGATVWSLDPSLEIGLSQGGHARMIQAHRVILATGAMERPFPIPGWTLPGVMTAGAAQTLMKASGLVPEGRVVLAGTGPLLWLLAAQMLRAGGAIEAILDTTPRANYWRALPHALGFLASPLFAKGLGLMREVRAKVRVLGGVTALAAEGKGHLAAIRFSRGEGREQRMEADRLLLHQGVVPNVNLAMAAGVQHRWDEIQLCWSPVLDSNGNTSVEGIAIAGDGAGIAGARAAEERGRLAGIAAAKALGARTALDASRVAQALRRHEAGRAFLDRLYQPVKAFRVPDDDSTIVCRCEEVTAGQIRATVQLGCQGPTQMKSFLRCGMGPCQGRLCGLTVTETIAAARGLPPAEIGYYRLRPPVKPITLGELAALPATREVLNT